MDLIGQLTEALGKLEGFAEEYWQISIIAVIAIIGYIIYAVMFK